MTEYKVTLRFRLPGDPDIRAIVAWLERIITAAGGSGVAVEVFDSQKEHSNPNG